MALPFESLPLRKITKQKGVEKIDTFCFLCLVASLLVDQGIENKRMQLAAFCAVRLARAPAASRRDGS